MARALGVWDVDGLLSSIPAGVYVEWLEFLSTEPLSAGEDVAQARLVTLLANANRKPGSKAYNVADMMLSGVLKPKRKRTTWADVKAWALAHNAAWRSNGDSG